MKQQQFDQPIADLGFEPELGSTNNYPDGFIAKDEIEQERKINQNIIRDNG